MKYSGEHLKEISFPLGGIGSGCIGLSGDGRLVDWEIFNRPNKGGINGYSHIAVKAKWGDRVVTKVLNGDLQKDYIGKYQDSRYSAYGHGAEKYSMCGFPHFKNVEFDGEFPIAALTFTDEDFPGKVKLTAFNPFIPLDAKNSSIPGAFFAVEIENDTNLDIEYQIAISVQNPFDVSQNVSCCDAGISYINLKNAGDAETAAGYGDLTVATDCGSVFAQSYWYRGGWQDSVVSYWNDFHSNQDISQRTYENPGKKDTCTLCAKMPVQAGTCETSKFVLTWNLPNCYNYWSPYQQDGNDVTWKNYYATVFPDSVASAKYALKNWDDLYKRTSDFKDSLYSATLDETVKEAIGANLAVLKSPTVLRLEDGSFYGWEGVHQQAGCCEGTCQHVWNYAYALCFLYPELERSIREAEFRHGMDEDGKSVFRLTLPYGREKWDFRACVDGQMGIVFKTYREWKISGDDCWLKAHWQQVKLALEYAWSEKNPDRWDADKDGILEGRQHHTLDMELFGPSSWLESMYLLALKAAAEMAAYLGEAEKAKEYLAVFEKGRQFVKDRLFNGEYFIQQIDIKDKSIVDAFANTGDYWNDEKKEIKYQIQNGSVIDQMLGQWHAKLLGLGDIFDSAQVQTALASMMRYNFKENMRGFANPWRVFSLNDESGTVMCDYPDGTQKPAIPIPYCEETMTGFEYAFAGLLISYGMIDEGIKVVKAVRDRYDGKKRNPWNEVECGSNYARSMASFALMPIFSGFEFDLPRGHIGFAPKVNAENFKSLWSLETGWGTFQTGGNRITIHIHGGYLELSSIGVPAAQQIKKVIIDGKMIDFTASDDTIKFDGCRTNCDVEMFL